MGGHDYDYGAIEPDPDKAPEDYHYTERRAEILQRIREHGNTWDLSRTDLAKHYDTAIATITNDIQRIAESLDTEEVKKSKVTALTAMQKAVQEAQAEGEYEKAFDISMKWMEWLTKIGVIETAPDKLEADITQREASTESDSYEVVTAEDDVELDQPTDAEAEVE